jgi:two-component system NtrC family sensor kinase
VAEATVAFLAPLARKRNVDLKLVLPPERLDCEVDTGQMQQVLTNLVVNGVHACSQGGSVRVVLERRHAAPPADVGGEAGEYVQASVQDSGQGIPPEHLPRIFEPFFTTKDVGEGTGLGLAVSWGIVREHGGWIEVENDFGHGATFSVYLPARMAEVTA